MSAADTDARREGAGMGSLRAVSGGVEASMFQDGGRPTLPELHGLGAPSCPHTIHSGGSAQNPMPMRLPPVAPVPPLPEAIPRRKYPVGGGYTMFAERYRRLYYRGHPTPPIGTLEASGHRGNSTPAHALVAGAGNGE